MSADQVELFARPDPEPLMTATPPPPASSWTDENPWGAEAHMVSLKVMAEHEQEAYTGMKGTDQGYLDGLRMARHVLGHLFGTEQDCADVALRAIAVIDDLIAKAGSTE